jgi:hypothetical protein
MFACSFILYARSYFHNNFYDASKQDAMALLLEQATIRRDNGAEAVILADPFGLIHSVWLGRATASKLIDDNRPLMVKIVCIHPTAAIRNHRSLSDLFHCCLVLFVC